MNLIVSGEMTESRMGLLRDSAEITCRMCRKRSGHHGLGAEINLLGSVTRKLVNITKVSSLIVA